MDIDLCQIAYLMVFTLLKNKLFDSEIFAI